METTTDPEPVKSGWDNLVIGGGPVKVNPFPNKPKAAQPQQQKSTTTTTVSRPSANTRQVQVVSNQYRMNLKESLQVY